MQDGLRQRRLMERRLMERRLMQSGLMAVGLLKDAPMQPKSAHRWWRFVFLAFAVAGTMQASVAAADGAWLEKVPARDHDRKNPYQGRDEAAAAGHRLYLDHCAQCHGEDAGGTKKRPPLTSPRIQQQATEGDLHWLLVNGNMKKGMPSWAKLPDQQLWQLITYVKTLHP
jgi:mono/diheme cytochrome c family protein